MKVQLGLTSNLKIYSFPLKEWEIPTAAAWVKYFIARECFAKMEFFFFWSRGAAPREKCGKIEANPVNNSTAPCDWFLLQGTQVWSEYEIVIFECDFGGNWNSKCLHHLLTASPGFTENHVVESGKETSEAAQNGKTDLIMFHLAQEDHLFFFFLKVDE